MEDRNGKLRKALVRESMIESGCTLVPSDWPPVRVRILLNLFLWTHPDRREVVNSKVDIGKHLDCSPGAIESVVSKLTLNLDGYMDRYIASSESDMKLSREKAWWSRREYDIVYNWMEGHLQKDRRWSKTPGGSHDYKLPTIEEIARMFGRNKEAVADRVERINAGFYWEEDKMSFAYLQRKRREFREGQEYKKGFGLKATFIPLVTQ